MANPNVAVFLLRVRELHGLTQAQAARLAGISTGMLSMLEHGKRRPSVVVAERLAAAYKIPEDARGLLMAEALPGVGKDWRSSERAGALGRPNPLVKRTPPRAGAHGGHGG